MSPFIEQVSPFTLTVSITIIKLQVFIIDRSISELLPDIVLNVAFVIVTPYVIIASALSLWSVVINSDVRRRIPRILLIPQSWFDCFILNSFIDRLCLARECRYDF